MTGRPLRERAARWAQRALPVAVVAGCVALAHAFGLVLCPLKRFLGVPCPTCGSTRALALLLRGDVCGAFEMQPLAMAIACVIAPCLLAARAALGKARFGAAVAHTVRSPLFWAVAAAATAANWAYVIFRGN